MSHRRAIEVAESSPAVLEDPIVQHALARGPIPKVGSEKEHVPTPTASDLAYGGHAAAKHDASHQPANHGKQASALSRLSEAGSAILDQVVISATAFLDRMPGVRKLTAEEIARHRKIFGNTIDFSAVRIVGVGPVMFEGIHAGMTLGNYMILIGNWKDNTSVAHELTHVWQSQNGRYFKYIPEAAAAISKGDDGYDWTADARAGKPWSELNPEQQASYVEQSYFEFMNADQFSAPVVCGTEPEPDPFDRDPYFTQARYQVQCGVGAPGRRPKPPTTKR